MKGKPHRRSRSDRSHGLPGARPPTCLAKPHDMVSSGGRRGRANAMTIMTTTTATTTRLTVTNVWGTTAARDCAFSERAPGRRGITTLSARALATRAPSCSRLIERGRLGSRSGPKPSRYHGGSPLPRRLRQGGSGQRACHSRGSGCTAIRRPARARHRPCQTPTSPPTVMFTIMPVESLERWLSLL